MKPGSRMSAGSAKLGDTRTVTIDHTADRDWSQKTGEPLVGEDPDPFELEAELYEPDKRYQSREDANVEVQADRMMHVPQRSVRRLQRRPEWDITGGDIVSVPGEGDYEVGDVDDAADVWRVELRDRP